MTRRVRIGILMRRYAPARKSHMPDLVGRLVELGALVEVIHADERLCDAAPVRVAHDLYVLKEKTAMALSLAGALHSQGAAILNPYPASLILRDKIATFQALRAAGVPTPDSYAVADPHALATLLDGGGGPLVVKPFQGSNGRGVRVARTPADLADGPPVGGDEPTFAQRYLPPDGRDRKLYGIGSDVFGVKRVWPATTHEEKLGESFTVPPELADIVHQCGRALGIDLIGVDVVESGGQPFVVDASSFPGFKGVPEAPAKLARHIHATAQLAARGDPLVASDTAPMGGRLAQRAFAGSTLQFVLNVLSNTAATPQELDEIRRLLDAIQKRAVP
jgi:ribosomal protein S6--L-glutamate ligase